MIIRADQRKSVEELNHFFLPADPADLRRNLKLRITLVNS